MKIYCVAITEGKYMMPHDEKIYKRKSTAQKKCDELNGKSKKSRYKVLLADNWHEE